jgi:2,2-dialkylglycine decarboxylase (pyruvate)
MIGDIRGRGVLLGIDLVRDPATKEPANDEAKALVALCQKKGLVIQNRGSHGRNNVAHDRLQRPQDPQYDPPQTY